ncbi:MAG: hypothetical protein HRT89_13995, partial [Lentisphaeria bacterium]|nr:hypothetical protein [Lentisphaeria bacterium]NQZ69167.1 hypothetical protein [Lentisphaeria bacterium]
MIKYLLISVFCLCAIGVQAGEYIPVYNPKTGELLLYKNSIDTPVFKKYLGLEGKIKFIDLNGDSKQDFIFKNEFEWEGQDYMSIRIYLGQGDDKFYNVLNKSFPIGADFEVGDFRGDDGNEILIYWYFEWGGST